MVLLLSFDLSGAEWNIVAYASGDPRMVAIAQGDLSPHAVTGSLLYDVPVSTVLEEYKRLGKERRAEKLKAFRKTVPSLKDLYLPPTMCIYQSGKKADLSLNYGVQVPTFAKKADVSEREGKIVREKYHGSGPDPRPGTDWNNPGDGIYPGIRDWWAGTQEGLARDRTITNCFGRKVTFLQNWKDCLEDAYAAIPQSTVADIMLTAMPHIYDDPDLNWLEPLGQIHDELLFQTKVEEPQELAGICNKVIEHMSPALCYNDREFTLDVGLKVGRRWGEQDMIEVKPTPEELSGWEDGLLVAA